MSNKVKDGSIASFSNYSNLPNPNICYNKFLTFYNLPLLPKNQTIKTLILHIDQHNNNKSITNISFSFNSILQETHVYLPNEMMLPYYSLILLQDLPLYYSFPLQSYSSQLTGNNNDDYNHHHLNLNIATHNVRGFNNPTKRETWQSYCINQNITIASITETKIADNTKLSFCNNNLFTYYWANSSNSAEGTAIMIRNYLKPHVHSCYTHLGGAIVLDLFFKSHTKLRIISVYLSSTDSNK
jgi:hypothetical protein